MEDNIILSEIQQRAVDLISTNNVSLIFGQSRSGKSFTALYYLLKQASETKGKYAILTPKLSWNKRAIIYEALPNISNITGTYYNLTNLPFVATLPNGSEIWFGGFNFKFYVRNILDKKYNSIWIDFIEDVDYHQFLSAKNCLLDKSAKLILTGNPSLNLNKKKSKWIEKIFIDRIDVPTGMPLDDNSSFSVMDMTIREIPISEAYLKRLQNLPADVKKRFL